MPSLPTVGASTNTWGTELNAYLQVSHAADGAFNGYFPQNTQTDNYGLVLADAGKVIEMNKSTAVNLTVPLNSSQAFEIGTCIEVFQLGAGQVTVVATGGVTIRSLGGNLKLAGQYSSAALRKRATDEWTLIGNLIA